jgi:hypothetical protein
LKNDVNVLSKLSGTKNVEKNNTLLTSSRSLMKTSGSGSESGSISKKFWIQIQGYGWETNNYGSTTLQRNHIVKTSE